MSGVYIKNMGMPERCELCPCYYYEYHECNALISYHVDGKGMPPGDCPLIAVPEHGRLIDADALLQDIRDGAGYEAAQDANDYWIGEAETIIPADYGEENNEEQRAE